MYFRIRTLTATVLLLVLAVPAWATGGGIWLVPEDFTTEDGGQAVFRAEATNSTANNPPPVTYQWNRDGVAVAGATSATWRPTVTLADDGAVITCTIRYQPVSEPVTETTDPVVLTVVPAGTLGGADIVEPAGDDVDSGTTYTFVSLSLGNRWTISYDNGRETDEIRNIERYDDLQRLSLVVPDDAPLPTTLTVSVVAGDDSEDTRTWAIDLQPVPPVCEDDNYEVQAGGILIVPAPGVLANDTDLNGDLDHVEHTKGPRLTSSADPLLTDPGVLTLNADGSFTYQAPNEDHDLYPATVWAQYYAYDSTGLKSSNSGSIRITINPPSTVQRTIALTLRTASGAVLLDPGGSPAIDRLAITPDDATATTASGDGLRFEGLDAGTDYTLYLESVAAITADN